MWVVSVLTAVTLVLCVGWAVPASAGPCPRDPEGGLITDRALVLSGGGAKGAFEAGAVYHLVVHRGCDFTDLSGVSAGALNAAFLAQAPSRSQSQANLA